MSAHQPENDVFACCEHCGPLTPNHLPAAVYGSGDGHAKPCPSCQGHQTESEATPMAHSKTESAEFEREALTTFFGAHRPIPCSIYSATERANWYVCTCEKWESGRTRSRAEEHHISEFEKHMADVLIATGWHVFPPAWPCDNYVEPSTCLTTGCTTPCDQCRVNYSPASGGGA